MGATYGKTLKTENPNVYHVIVRFHSEHGMRFPLQTVVTLLGVAAVADPPLPLAEHLQEAQNR